MKAVVLLSGGLDSTVCMAEAHQAGYELWPISFDYQQRHSRELDSARQVAKYYKVERHLVIADKYERHWRQCVNRPGNRCSHGRCDPHRHSANLCSGAKSHFFELCPGLCRSNRV